MTEEKTPVYDIPKMCTYDRMRSFVPPVPPVPHFYLQLLLRYFDTFGLQRTDYVVLRLC